MVIRAARKRYDAILRRGDLKEMQAYMVETSGRKPSNQHVVEITLHKLRLENTNMPDTMRRESAQWLRVNGMSRYSGEPVPLPNQPLPE